MSPVVTNHDVLTLEEAAGFLRVPLATAERLASLGNLPGRRVDHEWRFLKKAIEDWLRARDYKQILVDQAGALKDDESLPTMLAMIYAARGRPEVGDSEEG